MWLTDPMPPLPGSAQADVAVLAVADTDSYLKWSMATLRHLPAAWTRTQLVVANPVQPSPAQIRAVGDEPVGVVSRRRLLTRIARSRPDVVLLACTGPVVRNLTDATSLRRPDRPVLVTGLPGIAVPATSRAIRARAGCDLFVVHSRRELAEFSALGAGLAPRLRFGLARLPFLDDLDGPDPDPGSTGGADLVFAAQAKVPSARADREAILLGLATDRAPVVKLRAGPKEQQTHRETWPYATVLADLVAAEAVAADRIRLAQGSMHDALVEARGLVTVSSTAALEAIARRLPVLVLSDFGVSAELINLVFEGSGCLGTLDDLRTQRLRHPDPAWLETNYFHRGDAQDWQPLIFALLAQRVGPGLGPPPARGRWSARARRRLRLVVPAPVWQRLLDARARWRRLRGWPGRGRTVHGPPPGRPAGSAPVGPPPGPPVGRRPSPPASPLRPSERDR